MASGDTFRRLRYRKPVIPLAVKAPDIAKADLRVLSPDCPVQVIRTWTIRNQKLVLQFELSNKTDEAIEIGHLGIPLIFNNIITDRKLPEAHEKNSFSDPYIALDAGYVQVTRLKGSGPALVVVPEGDTPFEAYQPLREPTRPLQTAEGMFEWVVRSKALSEKDWGKAEPWNPPTSEILPPRGRREIGLRFLLADSIRSIEDTLKADGRPVAVGIPGYVLPNDIEGKLFLNAPSKVASVTVEPERAMTIAPARAPSSKWHAFAIKSNGWGRVRLTVKYSDGKRQTIHYYLTKPATQVVADLGNFLFTKQWYENPSDPFGRSPSIMGYDREANKVVEQDHRVWIAGLGDEGGGGSWVAGGDEAVRSAECARDREIRTVHRRCAVGRPSIQRWTEQIRGAKKHALLRSGRVSKPSVRQESKLDDVGKLEKRTGDERRPRIQLSARRRRVLVDVSQFP